MPSQPKLMDHIQIKVDGADLPVEAMNDLLEVTVDTNLYLPDAFTIALHDEGLKWVDSGPFVLGKEVEIGAQPETGGASKVLIKGEITALEPEFGEGTQATLVVRGYARSHRLHRGTHSEAYQQVTDSDLATRIAQAARLRAQVDPTSEVYDHVLQCNQTHMEFLSERAQRIGYECYVEDKTLYFRKPTRGSGPLNLEWGKELRTFRPRLTLAEQVDEVFVRGWDPKAQQVITGRSNPSQAAPQTGFQQSGAQLASAAFSSASRVVVHSGAKGQAEADSLAQALFDEITGAFIEAEGLCYGQPDLRAGKSVQLSSLGRQFSGTYFVTSATHIYKAGAQYATAFSIHGRRPETLAALLAQPSEETEELAGPVIGIVTRNNDPDGWGRVKVRFPWLSDTVESAWARIIGVGGGPDRGLYWLPEINDEVLVVFEQGDVNRPYVLGGLWNGQGKPPLPNSQALANGNVQQRIIKTRAGHKLTLIDDSDTGVILETAGGHRLTLADQKKTVVLETAGGMTLMMDDSQNQVELKSGGNLTIKSGANLTIDATGSLELKGSTFSLSSQLTGEVKAEATLAVKGKLVTIN